MTAATQVGACTAQVSACDSATRAHASFCVLLAVQKLSHPHLMHTSTPRITELMHAVELPAMSQVVLAV